MRCLWITREYPYPADAGDVIYSSQLIESLRDAGAGITVICHQLDNSTASPPPPDRIDWRIVSSALGSDTRGLASPLPNLAHRYDRAEMRAAVDGALARSRFDAVVIDHIGSGWALRRLRRTAGGIKLVYVAHNHETSTRRLVAGNAGSPVRRSVLRWDANKTARLESELVARADVVTAITPDDAARFAAMAADTAVPVLLPGYGGPMLTQRSLTAALPRRVVILGSFDWVAKRMNLEEFVAAADPIFATAGVELVVVGRGPRDWQERMQASTRATRFTGYVDSIEAHLDLARLGIVAERSGGGFKLKVLDYVFHRVPVATIEGSLSGVPLVPNESVLVAGSATALAERIVDVVDDLDRLNSLQTKAFDACRPHFEWASRGRDLLAAIEGG